MSKELYSTTVHVTGGRDGNAKSDDGNLNVNLKTPNSMGGQGGATNPEQLFAAGYAACFIGAMKLVAKKQQVSLPDGLAIDSHVNLNQSADENLDIAVKFDVSLPGLEQAQAEKLVETAHQVCPYSRATRGNIDFAYDITV